MPVSTAEGCARAWFPVDLVPSSARRVTFAVPSNAPNTLFYDCAIHVAMTGTIHIVN